MERAFAGAGRARQPQELDDDGDVVDDAVAKEATADRHRRAAAGGGAGTRLARTQ